MLMKSCFMRVHSFFYTDTATTQTSTLSLHDALPIWIRGSYFESCNCDAICPCRRINGVPGGRSTHGICLGVLSWLDRKSTRLNSSHSSISYAVFCLKKKSQDPLAGTPHRDQLGVRVR